MNRLPPPHTAMTPALSGADRSAMARLALSCLDLTSLNDEDHAGNIETLCARAHGACGPVAAVCVWPRWAALARRLLPAEVAVAAVANFPDGGVDTQRALRDVGEILHAGAQEVDVVLPWRAMMSGDDAAASALLHAVRRACEGHTLKVILETGELVDEAQMRRAARLALDAGADFLKTSTGKTAVGATPLAARVLLTCIVEHGTGTAATVGFKASGGIRTLDDAVPYLSLCQDLLGPQALHPSRVRLGASSLLNDIERVLTGGGVGDGRGRTATAGGY